MGVGIRIVRAVESVGKKVERKIKYKIDTYRVVWYNINTDTKCDITKYALLHYK